MRRPTCASTKSCFRVRLSSSKPVSTNRSPSSSGSLPFGVQATLASSVAGGDLSIPVHLRYQACDVNLCYPPSTADLQWTVAVAPASRTIDGPGDPICQQIAFGQGESPAAPPTPASAATPALAGETGVAQLDDFTVLGTTGGWTPSLAAGLAAARREHKPVLIDMWATWCKNCLVMDRTTLANADVRSVLTGYVKIKYQAEQPDASPAKDVMKRFDGVGLPTYVILRPIGGR
jgi:thiol-disulfide isomerase/thioredoxin